MSVHNNRIIIFNKKIRIQVLAKSNKQTNRKIFHRALCTFSALQIAKFHLHFGMEDRMLEQPFAEQQDHIWILTPHEKCSSFIPFLELNCIMSIFKIFQSSQSLTTTIRLKFWMKIMEAHDAYMKMVKAKNRKFFENFSQEPIPSVPRISDLQGSTQWPIIRAPHICP